MGFPELGSVSLYCDEGASGSMISITAGADGSLKKLGLCSAPGGAVVNTLYANWDMQVYLH
jgi:hypothetical protein